MSGSRASDFFQDAGQGFGFASRDAAFEATFNGLLEGAIPIQYDDDGGVIPIVAPFDSVEMVEVRWEQWVTVNVLPCRRCRALERTMWPMGTCPVRPPLHPFCPCRLMAMVMQVPLNHARKWLVAPVVVPDQPLELPAPMIGDQPPNAFVLPVTAKKLSASARIAIGVAVRSAQAYQRGVRP